METDACFCLLSKSSVKSHEFCTEIISLKNSLKVEKEFFQLNFTGFFMIYEFGLLLIKYYLILSDISS